MVRPNFTKWDQSPEDIRQLSLKAPHARTRERFQALYAIGTKRSNARQWAQETNRCQRSVLNWIHRYNESGPESLSYQVTGGVQARLSQREEATLCRMVEQSSPRDHGLTGHGWTLKKLKCWVSEQLGREVSRSLLHRLLQAAGFSWKKSKKVLAKGDPLKKAAFLTQFEGWFEQMVNGQIRLIYVDECHLHQDMETGYRWSKKGEVDDCFSSSPSLSQRLNWYGAYDFSTGQCFIWHQGYCNSDHTVEFLIALKEWLGESDTPISIIWDGASWHSRSLKVRQQAPNLAFTLITLPPYSPDLNPIEGLWKWVREEVTQHFCHDSLADLEADCRDFITRINLDPDAVVRRLWPKFSLDDPEPLDV